MTVTRIPLSDVLANIATEIRKAHEKATSEEHPVMKFQECELEFAVDLEQNASGGIQVWVINLTGGAKRTDSNTVKVKYTAMGDYVAAVEANVSVRDKPKRAGKKVK